jgi:hypothetical protein
MLILDGYGSLRWLLRPLGAYFLNVWVSSSPLDTTWMLKPNMYGPLELQITPDGKIKTEILSRIA